MLTNECEILIKKLNLSPRDESAVRRLVGKIALATIGLMDDVDSSDPVSCYGNALAVILQAHQTTCQQIKDNRPPKRF